MTRGRLVLWLSMGLLAVPALVLTVMRIFGPESGLALRLTAFVPFAIPLYAVALVLALVLVVVGRRRGGARTLSVVISGVLAIALAWHCWWFAPQVVGSTPEAASGDRLVVMAANLLVGRADAAALVTEAGQAKVDVLVVNEITGPALERLDRAGLGELLPHRAGEPGESTEGTMIFSDQPIELLERLRMRFDSMVVEIDGRTILGVHPSPPTLPESFVVDHQVLLAAVRDHQPDVVAGDFNATADHQAMRRLRDAGYRDTAELANRLQPTWPANDKYPLLRVFPPFAAIDHVLVGRRLTVVETGTVPLKGTDHVPVVATLAPRA